MAAIPPAAVRCSRWTRPARRPYSTISPGLTDGFPDSYGARCTGQSVRHYLRGWSFQPGTVFKLDPSGKEKVLHSFAGTGGDGA
jgi:hypothetical protein